MKASSLKVSSIRNNRSAGAKGERKVRGEPVTAFHSNKFDFFANLLYNYVCRYLHFYVTINPIRVPLVQKGEDFMLNKQQENFLNWLLSQKRDINNTISISNFITSYPKNYTEKDVIQKLNELESYELINIKWLGNNHRSLNTYITISLSKDALNYFNNKKRSKVTNRRDWIKTYVSVFALIISIMSMIISLLSLLLKVS